MLAIEIEWVHQKIEQDLRERIIQFWIDNGAICDPFEAWRRSFEVCCVAFGSDRRILAISSVYPGRSLLDGMPYWYFRAYVTPTYRRVGVINRMFEQTFSQLSSETEMPGAPIGLAFVTENQKLNKPGMVHWLVDKGYTFVGKDSSGQSIWKKLFLSNK